MDKKLKYIRDYIEEVQTGSNPDEKLDVVLNCIQQAKSGGKSNERLGIIVDCIEEAKSEGLLEEKPEILTGYSDFKLMGLLQRMGEKLLDKKTCYLEVGVFQGLTLLSSAMVSPGNHFYGIDNFAYFDPEKKNEKIIYDRLSKLNISNVHLINADYEDALENLSTHLGDKKVGIYFVDGPHDYRSQLMCLQLIKPYLTPNAVIIVDDSNYRHVRQANRDFLVTNPAFKLLYQSYTKAHPMNMTKVEQEKSRNGWWNGINILYHDPEDTLEFMVPYTLRDRTLYENEHLLHTYRYPEQSVVLMNLFTKFKLFPLMNRFRKPKDIFIGEYNEANTYSRSLPSDEYNKSIQK
ncbi:MAG: class I SAM-dependent methyltransferase [Bacteroidales bacterium]